MCVRVTETSPHRLSCGSHKIIDNVEYSYTLFRKEESAALRVYDKIGPSKLGPNHPIRIIVSLDTGGALSAVVEPGEPVADSPGVARTASHKP